MLDGKLLRHQAPVASHDDDRSGNGARAQGRPRRLHELADERDEAGIQQDARPPLDGVEIGKQLVPADDRYLELPDDQILCPFFQYGVVVHRIQLDNADGPGSLDPAGTVGEQIVPIRFPGKGSLGVALPIQEKDFFNGGEATLFVNPFDGPLVDTDEEQFGTSPLVFHARIRRECRRKGHHLGFLEQIARETVEGIADADRQILFRGLGLRRVQNPLRVEIVGDGVGKSSTRVNSNADCHVSPPRNVAPDRWGVNESAAGCRMGIPTQASKASARSVSSPKGVNAEARERVSWVYRYPVPALAGLSNWPTQLSFRPIAVASINFCRVRPG